MTLVLDLGSGQSLPDSDTARRFVDAIKAVDTGKHSIIIKAQLFKSAPPNKPLEWDVWRALYEYGGIAGYEVTASVFDIDCLGFLLGYGVPFIKVACRPSLYWLAGEIPRRVPVWVSVEKDPHDMEENGEWLACVPKYPATIVDYQLAFPNPPRAVSDHTVGWDLYNLWEPKIIEKHFVLPDTVGPDAGPWAVTPALLAEIM